MTDGPTPRQLEAIAAVGRMGSRKDAAAELGLSLPGLRDRLVRGYRRLGVASWPEAAYRLWLADLWRGDAGDEPAAGASVAEGLQPSSSGPERDQLAIPADSPQ